MTDFKMKACMIDISRFRVPKTERMKTMLKNISESGYDTVFFNIEHTFKTPELPRIGFEADGCNMEQFRDINEFASTIGLKLVPLIQSFGHMFHILKWKEFENISESEMKWSVSLSDQTYLLIDSLYKNASKVFNSEYIHIGGDEVYDMATGKSKELLQYTTKEKLFLNHILNLKAIAEKYGKKIVLWCDMIEKDPEVMKKLGPDTVVCYWNYDFKEMPESYKNIDAKILVCPGTNTWKSFFPRYDYAVKNFSLMKERADELNAFGYMITDWGDAGHIHPYSFTENLFNTAFRVFSNEKVEKYCAKDEINEIIKLLDKVHYADYLNSECVRNKPEYITKLMFHDSPFSGKSFSDQNDGQLSELLTRISQVEESVKGVSFDSEFEKDLKLFADQTILFGEKVKLHIQIRQNKTSDIVRNKVENYIVLLRRWFADFMANWLENSQPMGLYFHIHFEKKMEQELLRGLERYEGRRYEDIEKANLYDDPEYLNLFSVGSADALKTLWKKAML
jgi:hypothetical protein